MAFNYSRFRLLFFDTKAVQNERQPRNTATIRPENLLTMEESERMIREGVASTVSSVYYQQQQQPQPQQQQQQQQIDSK
jgi:hypothetical protein